MVTPWFHLSKEVQLKKVLKGPTHTASPLTEKRKLATQFLR